MKNKGGQWVQDYTRTGAPRQGHNRYRWRSNKQYVAEIIGITIFAFFLVLAVIWSIIVQ